MAAEDFDEDEGVNVKMKAAFAKTEAKLAQYYAPEEYPQAPKRKRFIQHALPLMKAVRALDPKKAPFISTATEDLEAIPGFGRMESTEYKIFVQQCSEVQENMEIIPYWRFLGNRYPALSRLALRYLSLPAGSVDAERSFSSQGAILTPQRLRLSRENRSRLTFMYVNAK